MKFWQHSFTSCTLNLCYNFRFFHVHYNSLSLFISSQSETQVRHFITWDEPPKHGAKVCKVSIWGWGEQRGSSRQLARVIWSTSKGKLFLVDVLRVKMNQTKTKLTFALYLSVINTRLWFTNYSWHVYPTISATTQKTNTRMEKHAKIYMKKNLN